MLCNLLQTDLMAFTFKMWFESLLEKDLAGILLDDMLHFQQQVENSWECIINRGLHQVDYWELNSYSSTVFNSMIFNDYCWPITQSALYDLTFPSQFYTKFLIIYSISLFFQRNTNSWMGNQA